MTGRPGAAVSGQNAARTPKPNQLSVKSNKWNADDKQNYSHATARRLPAEVLYDAIHRATGTVSKFPGYPDGTRAAQLADIGTNMGGGFLQTFGRPPRESACECERTGGMALGHASGDLSPMNAATSPGCQGAGPASPAARSAARCRNHHGFATSAN